MVTLKRVSVQYCIYNVCSYNKIMVVLVHTRIYQLLFFSVTSMDSIANRDSPLIHLHIHEHAAVQEDYQQANESFRLISFEVCLIHLAYYVHKSGSITTTFNIFIKPWIFHYAIFLGLPRYYIVCAPSHYTVVLHYVCNKRIKTGPLHQHNYANKHFHRQIYPINYKW
jgi:hypothetical protein